MAVKPFSKEQLNFFKFCTLVLDEFPKVLRQIFITMWDSKVAIRPGFTAWDDSTKVRNMLLASEGGKTDIPTTKSIEEWDGTALFKATIYAKTFGAPSRKGSTLNDLYLKKVKPAPGSFHSSVQSLTGNQDETYALAIDQLRLLRNTLCHSPKPEIIKTDFDNYVQLVTNGLTAVNIDIAFVDVIGQMTEDDFPTEKVQKLQDCHMRELQAISMFHENVEQKLSSIEKQTEKIENVEQKLYYIEEQREKIENVEGKLSSIDERTDEIHTMMKNISLGDKGNIPETLPKPYIPSSVPLFTGREDEVEEITNLITDQSTRLLNIWGTPGYGKTSTVIEVAHHLRYPVYFFKLQGITTVDEFLSKILSIFKSNLADLSLTPIDKLVSIFREISSPIFLIFDNLDDLLSSEASSAKLTRLFEELLDSNVIINILVTTRELLENMHGQITGFQDFRIRPLHPVSSVKFVRQLLPVFSESVVAKVARISSHVPLAMKLVASLVENEPEDRANKILEELSVSGNLLELIDSPYEKNMKRLFDSLFEQLTLSDKHALISLTVFSSTRISKDAVIDVVSGEMGVAKAVRSLKILLNKSLIDKDSNGEYYSIHPLIFSFVVDKAKQSDFENVFKSSRVRFSTYYLLLFERLNDDFLAGKSIESAQLQDTMLHLSIGIHQYITLENFEDLSRILSRSEIFLFLVGRPNDIPKLYDLAIEKCITQQYNNYAYKLVVSKYFYSIAFSLFFSYIPSDISERIREDVMLLSDGSAAKLGCYEGILLISKGNIKSGIVSIEKHLDGLQKCADQQLVKCLCLQLLAILYTDFKEYSKSSNFSRKAIEVCEEIGNCNLFLIGDGEQSLPVTQKGYKGEQIMLFVHLLYRWSEGILSDNRKLYLHNVVQKLQQQLESNQFGTEYLFQIVCYGDCLLAFLGLSAGQEVLLDEKIKFLDKSLKSDDCCSLTDMSEMSATRSHLADRLFNCYVLKIICDEHTENQDLTVDTCRNALDLSLKRYGNQNENTAFCYLKMGLAEKIAENYTSALNAFNIALEIRTAIHDGSKSSCAHLAQIYIGIGHTYTRLGKHESAIASFEEALKIKGLLFNEGSEKIAQILFFLGMSQFCLKDLCSGLATLEQALQIMIKLYAEKPSSDKYMYIVTCYVAIGKVQYQLGNSIESKNCFKTARKVSTDCDEDRSCAQSLICMALIDLNVDENLYTELLDSSLPGIKENYKSFLPMLYLTLGSKQLESGKYEAGLASLQEALDIELEVTLRENVAIRESTVVYYIAVVNTLVKIGKSKLARRAIDRATKIAESLPELGRQHLWVFRCYSLKGRILQEMPDYVTAIESLEYARLQLPKISRAVYNKEEEFLCHAAISAAYFYEGSFKDALSSMYDALLVIKDIFPNGSEDEGDLCVSVAAVAQKMGNKSLKVHNLRLAYKIYSKILGKNHSKTEKHYIAYARALIA